MLYFSEGALTGQRDLSAEGEASRKGILGRKDSPVKGERKDSERGRGTALNRARRDRGGKDSHGFREVIDRTAGTLFLFSGGSRGQLPRGTFRFSRDKDKPPGI